MCYSAAARPARLSHQRRGTERGRTMPQTNPQAPSRVAKQEHSAGSRAAKPKSSRLSSPDLVVKAVVDGIAAGRYVPGQRLVEADLTQALKVSRSSVREALERLAAERVIVLARHRSAHVRMLTRDQVDELMEVIEVLAGTAARWAADHIDEGDNRVLIVRSYERLMGHRRVGDSFAFMRDRDRFYGAMVSVGGNRELAYLLPATHVRLIRLQCQPFLQQFGRDEQFRDYEAIGEAILAGDAARAEECTRMHVRRYRELYVSLPDAAFAATSEI